MSALNSQCFCIGLDDERLSRALAPSPAPIDLDALVRERCPHLFAARPVFVCGVELERMAAVVRAVESVVALPAWHERVLASAPSIARHGAMGARSVFFGYDFHLDGNRLGLIEINTNAGGALLNAVAARAQKTCCAAVQRLLPLPRSADRLERDIVAMFQAEWQRAGLPRPLRRIAIVDTAPPDQYLDAAVLTPHPRAHALYADKRNLALLSDEAVLRELGVAAPVRELLLQTIPRTRLVRTEDPQALWAERRELFFKPASGFGSRAAYRGDKLTRRVWQDILAGDYVAQDLVLAGERRVDGAADGEEARMLKFDLRNYAYDGEVQWVAARLFQGQTTNFRTPGGGFAPVYRAPSLD